MKKFITAFNGVRDLYSVPQALAEEDLLERHVSDLYLPRAIAESRLFSGSKLKSRTNTKLPFQRVHIDFPALLSTALLRWRGESIGSDPYYAVDRCLSMAASRLAQQTGANLFLHSGFGYWAFERNPTVRRLLFQFHPHPFSIREILERDFERHPEVRWSFENEVDSRPKSVQYAERVEEWKLADRILCASTFTKQSLVDQGCDSGKIEVAPYGVDTHRHDMRISDRSRDHAACRFLFVGQGVQRKGLHHLLKAWRLADLPGAELLVVSRRMDPGIAALGSARVTFVNGLSQVELETLYSQCSVFVMPSLVEGFGLVYGEALNAGLYCIGTRNTGLPDLQLNSDQSILVSPGDVEGLAVALVDAHEKWRRGEIDKNSIANSVKGHTWALHRSRVKQFVASSKQDETGTH